MSCPLTSFILCFYLVLYIRVESLRIPQNLISVCKNGAGHPNTVISGFINFQNGLKPSHKLQNEFRRFNVAPPGSRIEFEMNRFKIDPLNNSPWDYESSIVDTPEQGYNISYRFLKNDWGYLDLRTDPNQPSGVIEGGPQNYEGKGLKLKGGKDRQRTEYLPYYLDHGVQYRQRVSAGSISFDIAPIATQDIQMSETDLDLERKQWGSWHRPDVSPVCAFPSLFRSHFRIENPTELPYPWVTRFDVFEWMPLHRERPSTLIPSPDPDWKLAALNVFAGYIPPLDDFLSTEQSLINQKKLLKEWTRLERLYKKTRKPELLDEIKEVKFALFGIPDFSDSEEEMLKLVSEVAIIRARMILKMQADDWRKDPEVIERYITRFERGELDPSSDYRGPEKTVALNLINYKPISKKFRRHTSIEEMAETYHRLITENRKEGRVHTRTHIPVEPECRQYPLRKYRKNFPSLEAEYRPVWANRSYGSEFGDAIRSSQNIPEDALTEFGRPLKKRKRRLTREERKRNFRDDYSSFKREYGY